MSPKARVILLDPERGSMPLDTGEDSIMVMYGVGESEAASPPETISVGYHEDWDEMIYIDSGEGYFIHGEGPETMMKTPWKGPCLLWMAAKTYHRVVTTSPGKRRSILTYTRAGAVVPRFQDAVKQGAKSLTVVFKGLPEGKPERAEPSPT
ncbi:MAG: hypothetical protein QW057_06360 [Candidatus Bathyarchaeia archaeon]